MPGIGYLLRYEDELWQLAVDHFGTKLLHRLKLIFQACPPRGDDATRFTSQLYSESPMADLLEHVGLPGGGRPIVFAVKRHAGGSEPKRFIDEHHRKWLFDQLLQQLPSEALSPRLLDLKFAAGVGV